MVYFLSTARIRAAALACAFGVLSVWTLAAQTSILDSSQADSTQPGQPSGQPSTLLHDQLPPDAGFGPGTQPRYAPAVGEILGTQLICNAFGRITDQYWSRITLNSWESNLTGPWLYDRDPWPVNEMGHPTQGAFYFSAARSNGMDFWESFLAASAGAASWELFGETHTPDTNDLITTSLGGAVVGEIMHRLYTVALDSDSPVQYFMPSLDAGNAAVFGKNPAFDRYEGRLPLTCKVASGFSYVNADLSPQRDLPESFEPDAAAWYASEELHYGRPFAPMRSPFDYFTQSFTFAATGEDYLLAWFSSGDLATIALLRDPKAKLNAVANLDYDFIYGDLFEFSANAFGLGLRGLWKPAGGWVMRGEIHLNFLALATTESVYLREDPAIMVAGDGNVGRDYDFGYGAGAKLGLQVSHPGYGDFESKLAFYDIRDVPVAVLPEASFDYAKLAILSLSYSHRILRHLSLGLDYTLYHKFAVYEDLPNIRESEEAVSLVAKVSV